MTNSMEVTSSSNTLTLSDLQNAQDKITEAIRAFVQPVIDNPQSYLPGEDGIYPIRAKEINLSPIYESFGIPTDFSQRKTQAIKAQVSIIYDTFRSVLRSEGLDVDYGYANREDSDTVRVKKSELEFTLPESKYDRLTAANYTVA
jgi:hypothetical protein